MFATDTHPEFIAVSYLRHVWKPSEGGMPRLDQARVTDVRAYDDFPMFVADFWSMASYPAAQSHKYECYSFVPTVFAESERTVGRDPFGPTRRGVWRAGAHSAHEITILYLDCDNQHSERTMVSFAEIGNVLRELGLSHLLYTSFSHTAERHKVRAIIPISRHITYDEAHRLFAWFNACFDYQLDGSIYDDGDHLYGPCFVGERTEWTGGGNLDVEAVLEAAGALPAEAWEFARRSERNAPVAREMTVEEAANYRAKVASMTVAANVSIENAEIVRDEWREELAACANGGSHRQTLMSVLSKVWLRSRGELTFGELSALQREMDCDAMGSYCHRKYGSRALDEDCRSVMRLVPSVAPVASVSREEKIAAELAKKIAFLRSRRG